MIKIPRRDVENCDAFHIPFLNGFDTFNFFIAKVKLENGEEIGSVRMSTFASSRIFSFEKFKSYIENSGGKVHLESTELEELYYISACNLSELQGVIWGDKYPVFLQNYDFNSDIHIRSTI